MVDKRTMERYQREVKEIGRESWHISRALSLTPSERDKGKTIEVGRGYFETQTRRYTILDAPGHKTYVPNVTGKEEDGREVPLPVTLAGSRMAAYG